MCIRDRSMRAPNRVFQGVPLCRSRLELRGKLGHVARGIPVLHTVPCSAGQAHGGSEGVSSVGTMRRRLQMRDEPTDPSDAAHIDLESTFSLIERARAGDKQALERLFARHLQPLQRWATGRLPKWARDLADTDDLVQDTLLRTFKKIESFEPRRVGALQAYLRNAVLNRLRDELRRKGRAPESTSLDCVEVQGADSPLEAAIGLSLIHI